MFTLLSTPAHTVIHEWKTAAGKTNKKTEKCKVLYFSYKQNFYKIYMHIYIYKRKNSKYFLYFLVKQAVPSKIYAWLFLDFLEKRKKKKHV